MCKGMKFIALLEMKSYISTHWIYGRTTNKVLVFVFPSAKTNS